MNLKMPDASSIRVIFLSKKEKVIDLLIRH